MTLSGSLVCRVKRVETAGGGLSSGLTRGGPRMARAYDRPVPNGEANITAVMQRLPWFENEAVNG
jgi:hypothetical protein